MRDSDVSHGVAFFRKILLLLYIFPVTKTIFKSGHSHSFVLLGYFEYEPMLKDIKDKVKELAGQVAEDEGLELVDVGCAGLRQQNLLRVTIDKEGGVKVGDCERMSRGSRPYWMSRISFWPPIRLKCRLLV